MEPYIDIHSHILPKVDDGSKSIEQTESMLEIAYREGIRTIIVTPHYKEGIDNNFFCNMEESLKELKEKLNYFSTRMSFYLGCEIYYSHECVNLLNQKFIPTMAESKYVLVEFSKVAEYQYIKGGLQEILFGGYCPILAHVERYDNIIKDIERVRGLINMGIYIQLNTMSIMGGFGRVYQKNAKKLLENRLVHFVATDAHSDGKRSPKIKKCAEYIARKYGKKYMEELLIENPNKILVNEYI